MSRSAYQDLIPQQTIRALRTSQERRSRRGRIDRPALSALGLGREALQVRRAEEVSWIPKHSSRVLVAVDAMLALAVQRTICTVAIREFETLMAY